MKQYDPKKVSTIIGVIAARGFADGVMIEVEFDEDERSKHIGTDGEGRHVKSANKSGKITIRLADYSPTNAVLTTLDTLDVPFPITIIDKTSNGALFFAESCAIIKPPNFVRGKEASENEWPIQFINGKMIHSGGKE